MNKHDDKQIYKYIEQVDLVDLYITKNICKIIKNKKEFEYIKSNLFLLGFNNKNRKNSLKILLDNSEFKIVEELIRYDNEILDIKTVNEVNLFQLLFSIEYFYDLIIDILKNGKIELVIKIVVERDINETNSIDIILSLININQEKIIVNIKDNKTDYYKLKNMLKIIYEFGREDLTLLITKLCSVIKSSEILLDILKYIRPDNLDIYPDKNMLTCIDYLLLTEKYDILEYLVPKINFIYFVNTESSHMFSFIKNYNNKNEENYKYKQKFIKLIFDILEKSDIKKIKNIKNENIFFTIFENYEIEPKIIKKYLDTLDIYEENTDGISIYDILKKKYNNQISIPNKINKITKNIDFKKILEKTDIGIFNSDVLHNIIYTIILLSKYKQITIPSFIQNKEYFDEHKKLLEMSNNQSYINSYLKLYFYNFTNIVPFIIIWKNKDNYYLDENLLKYLMNLIEKNNHKYIYVRLSINLVDNKTNNLRHANIILLDNKRKIVERFEPYGEINLDSSNQINKMIIEKISNPLGYNFNFVQPFPGFQARSDEFNKYNKIYGDPSGFCLAWCLLYVEIKLQSDELGIKTSPIELINNYVIKKFKKDYKEVENDNQNNLYMLFIRYYAKKLDTRKNELLKKLNINSSILYNVDLSEKNYKTIINKLNNELLKYIKN